MILSFDLWLRWLRFVRVILVGIVLLCPAQVSAESDDDFFESKIRPILTERCLSCHSAEKGKTQGGLALDTKQGWEKGGESGPTISPGDVDSSLLIRAVLYSGDGPQMPPEDAGGKLSDAEIALLKQWVQQGAHDPRTGAAKRGGMTEEQIRSWWSFQPLRPVAVPEVNHTGVRNEIDQFLRARLASEGLESSPEADRRTLIRRVTYDLTGLPPSPDDVDAFLADTSSTAYETVVERLLQSTHYGEHWGRHWLDVVRYADTAGENTDHPIPDAWRYRNWVIDAFNNDLPYDQFVREQIAGDIIHSNDPAEKYAAGIVSTGFLAIARRFDHDSDKFMHLTFEDTIDTMGQSILGLTIACARCHDHKFDPISSKDYYAIYGILNSTRFAFPGCEAKQQPRDLVPLLPPSEWARMIEPWDRQLASIDADIKSLQEAQAAKASEFKSATAAAIHALAQGAIADGGTTAWTDAPDHALNLIEVRSGQLIQLTIDPSENYGADSTLIEWEIAEIGGQERIWNLTKDVVDEFAAGNPHSDSHGNATTWLFLDGRGGPSLLSESVQNSSGAAGLHVWRTGDNPAVFVNSTEQALQVWTSLPPKTLFVHPAQDGPVALGWVSPIDGRVQIRGRIADAHPGGSNGVGWRIDHYVADVSAGVQQMAKTNTLKTQLLSQRAEHIAHAPARETAYAVTEGTVANVRMHLRGDPEKPGDEVPRRWLEILGGQEVPADSGSGRLQLAQWLTDRSNPLTARVMVNRIWQNHFGKGLVQTPNDFGTRGQKPTHPELLDWLANRFMESGWSIKAMHRLILLSAAYRQSSGNTESAGHAKALVADPNNHLYWRFDRQRLSAEELRDSLLVAGQQLDLSSGGPHSIPPTNTWSFSQHVPFAGVAESNKRSIYMMTLRNRRHAFLGLFDGADPNATTPQRQVTTVPTQSLYFMNDEFFHAQAEKVAERLLRQPDEAARVHELFRIVLQRSPTASELEAAYGFLQEYQSAITEIPATDQPLNIWSALSRLLMSSNEFLYLD
jgi:hypothetical protein